MGNQAVQQAYSAALRFLTQREHCEVELRQKLLQRDFDALAIDSALEQLKHYGYLSETRYAEAFLRARLKKGEALWFAAEKARQKGVDEEALQITVEAMNHSYDAFSSCKALLDKRDPQQCWKHDSKQWQKQARYLHGKGFDTNTIMQLLMNKEGEE